MAIIKLTIRSLDISNPQAGFHVTLDARDVDGTDFEALLPPIPAELQEALRDWKSAYSEQDGVRSHFRISGGQVKDRSVSDVINFSVSLRDEFNSWLTSADKRWVKIREKLVLLSRVVEQPRLILDLGVHDTLKRLPWQDWDLLADCYSRTDAALRAPNQPTTTIFPPGHTYPSTSKIRILVIVGESDDISTNQDLQAIQNLEQADPNHVDVTSLLQPTPKDLQTALDDPLGYHILIYVGHSRSSEDGQVGWLLLNQTDELSIRNFKLALKRVVQKGLQLVIFNSCDGLGLAQQLAEVDVPRCIVMKEPVPDEVAVEFLERFFHEFATKKQPLLAAIRNARYGLEHYNFQYSEVTWLPTICLKQNTTPLTWQLLLDSLKRDHAVPPSSSGVRQRQWLLGVGAAAVLVGAIALIPPIRCQFAPCSPAVRGDSTPDNLIPAERLISAGDTRIEGSIQLNGEYETLKQLGIDEFAAGNYAAARDTFAQIRETAKETRSEFINSQNSREYIEATHALQDPEVLILKNNAEVRLRHEAGEPIYRIVAAVPLSDRAGVLLNIGQQMLFGVAQAQDKAVNRENAPINLEIVIANDLNVPAQSEAIAQAIVEATLPALSGQPILSVIGHYTSRGTCDALPIYADANLVVISPLSTVMDLRGRCGGSNLFFRTTSSTQIEARTLVKYLRGEIDQPRIAVFFNPAEFYSYDLYKEFEAALDGSSFIVSRINLSENNFDADAKLRLVEDANALVVLPDGRTGDSKAFDNALDVLRADAGRRLILGSAPLYTANWEDPENRSLLERLENKLVIATDWFKDKCAPLDFVKESEENYWFGGLNRITAVSYEAVEVLLPTLSRGVDSAAIQQKLSTGITNSSVFRGETISFDGDGNREELQTRILTILVNNSKDPFKLVPGTCPQDN